MSNPSIPDLLPPQADDIVWRILGGFVSPEVLSDLQTLIDGIVQKRLPPELHNDVKIEIKGWIQQHGDRHWLRPEVRVAVAERILRGVGIDLDDTRLWALGAVDPDVIQPLIVERWTAADIDRVCRGLLDLVARMCARDLVLDPRSIGRMFGQNATVSKGAFAGHSELDRYKLIERHDPSLADSAVHTGLRHLVQLCLGLRPDLFGELVMRAEHPSIRLLAANFVYYSARACDHRCTLTWLTPDASDTVVALAILKTIESVNALDAEDDAIHARGLDFRVLEHHHWRFELRPPADFRAAAGALVEDLVARIDALGELRAATWFGEALAESYFLLPRRDSAGTVNRHEQFENACIAALRRRVAESADFDALLTRLLTGLRRPPRDTHLRHLGALAWLLREELPERSRALAERVLDDYRAKIAEGVNKHSFYYNIEDAEGQKWSLAIGMSLALIVPDPLKWIRERATELPLTVWDAEEEHAAFLAAQDAADHLIFVGMRAVEYRAALANSVPRGEVSGFFDLYWQHRRFCGCQSVVPKDSRELITEIAVRVTARHGELRESTVIELLRSNETHPRVMVALLEVHPLRDPLRREVAQMLLRRFEVRTPTLRDILFWWGRVWLTLERPDGALLTLQKFDALRAGESQRPLLLLFLELALLVLEKAEELDPELDQVPPELPRFAERLYDQLWRYEDPEHEREQRRVLTARMRKAGLLSSAEVSEY